MDSNELTTALATMEQRIQAIEAKQEKHGTRLWVPFGASAGIFVTLFLLVLTQQSGILSRMGEIAKSIAVIEQRLSGTDKVQETKMNSLTRRLEKLEEK